ncbi:MAG: lasso peptide biosynthesis B2 protein [Novosphingobium sp.]
MADPTHKPRGAFRSRLETLEAMAFLVAARILIGCIRFARWRHLLGAVSTGRITTSPAWIDRYLARVVDRAASHLPFECLCLPRAMALHWMLHRRGRGSELIFAALPDSHRGNSDDLHAWVERGGEMLIGQTAQPHQTVVRFGFSDSVAD